MSTPQAAAIVISPSAGAGPNISPTFTATGLTGATAASRYVGATTSGAPASGTFAVGDFVVDQTGKLWVCTVAGTPGTWVGSGTGLVNPMTTLGDLIYGAAAGAATRLAGNAAATKEFLTSTGSGSAATAPAWGAIAAADLPAATSSTQGAVELTGDLGGSATSPTVVATHLAAALPIAQGGTGAITQQAALDALAGAVTSGQVLRGNGTHVLLAALQAGDIPTIAESQVTNLVTDLAARALLAGATFTGYVAPAVFALTDATTITVDASKGNTFTVTLGGSRTLANPTNPVDGQRIIFRVQQGAAGGPFTLSYGTAYSFSTSLPQPTLSTAANAIDYLGFAFDGAASKWRFLAYVSGFS